MDLKRIITESANKYYIYKYRRTIPAAERMLTQWQRQVALSDNPVKAVIDILSGFEYRRDRFDFTNEPVLFAVRGKGDCDDYANMACYLLRSAGIDCRFLAVFRRGAGHAVCAFRRDGNMWGEVSNWTVNSKWRADQSYCTLVDVAGGVYFDWRSMEIRHPLNYKLMRVEKR